MKRLIDFIAIGNRLKRDVLDAMVVRGMFSGSDHFCSSGKKEVFETFRKSVIRTTEEVVGYVVCEKGEKGNAWWASEIKEAVMEKKSAYKMILQRNTTEEVRER